MKKGKRDTSKKRESILDGAVRAFCDDGYESTSMDRIAEIAGASKRTVYNHFESKEALFQAVINRFMDEVSSLKDISYDPGQSLEKQLGYFADAKLAIVQNPSWFGLVKVTMGVFIRDPKLAKKTMDKAIAGENSLVLWLNAAKDDKKLQFKDAELAAEMFWAMVGGALFWPQIFQGPLNSKEIGDLKTELIKIFLSRYGQI